MGSQDKGWQDDDGIKSDSVEYEICTKKMS